MENLKEILSRHGFSFKKAFGQNFLTDGNLLAAIAESADCAGGTVLEIGAGAGALTLALSDRAKKVISFEIDRSLQPILIDIMSDRINVEICFEDVMKRKMSELERDIGEDYIVAANLPYYITTPLLMRFVEESAHFKRQVVMVQEEVADRLTARENTSAFGAITVAVDAVGTAKKIRRVPRELFTPRPNVDSAVVRIDLDRAKYPIADRACFRETLRAGFNNRRKTLCNNLMQSFSLTRLQAEGLLTDCGIDLKARGETLSTERFVALSNLIKKRKEEEHEQF